MLENWAQTMISRINATLPNAEIVVMSSSFPDSFKHIIGNYEERAYERQIFDAIAQRNQQANLTFGDWGSTRLSQSGGGGKIPSRVDIPRTQSWQIFRADPDLDPGYHATAQQAAGHSSFSLVPDCTGKRMVQATDGQGTGITGTQKNTQARINMHMTIQTGASHTIELDEQPYSD